MFFQFSLKTRRPLEAQGVPGVPKCRCPRCQRPSSCVEPAAQDPDPHLPLLTARVAQFSGLPGPRLGSGPAPEWANSAKGIREALVLHRALLAVSCAAPTAPRQGGAEREREKSPAAADEAHMALILCK